MPIMVQVCRTHSVLFCVLYCSVSVSLSAIQDIEYEMSFLARATVPTPMGTFTVDVWIRM